jgi:hypothetical protein
MVKLTTERFSVLARDPATQQAVCGTDAGDLLLLAGDLLDDVAFATHHVTDAVTVAPGVNRVTVLVSQVASRTIDLNLAECMIGPGRRIFVRCGFGAGTWYVRPDSVRIVEDA